jgi:hypothetical protein
MYSLLKTVQPLLVGLVLTVLLLAVPLLAQTPSTMPSPAAVANSTANPPASVSDPLLGKLFRSRIDGIQFNPPAGGTLIREVNSSEIVRFVYADSSWDLRVKPINLATPKPLGGATGLVELTASQLQEMNQAAVILTRDVEPIGIGGTNVGLIEARYLAGTNVIYAQQALIQDNPRHYFSLQMISPGKPKDAPAQDKLSDAEEKAREIFRHVIASAQVLDRDALAEEQVKRAYQTRQLWVLIDKKKIVDAMLPQHFMRVLQDGKDIGFVQIDERLATHHGHEGIEYIVHSRVESGGQQVTDPGRYEAPQQPASPGDEAGIVVPKGVAAPAGSLAAAQVTPTSIYTNATYFVTFDRAHEDWTTTTQADQQVTSQLTEMGNSDLLEKRMLDAQAMAEQIKAGKKPADRNGNPPTTQKSDFTLDVAQYARGGRVGKPVHAQLPPFYIPQVIGQMLPRLLPPEPAQYFFASYVSSQKNVMARYVDVEPAKEVTIDDRMIRAIPITDRIGVDGVPTIHYVTRDGGWIGSVNEDAKLTVLPTDQRTLEAIWKGDKQGFAVSPIDPLPMEPAPVKKKGSKASVIEGEQP